MLTVPVAVLFPFNIHDPEPDLVMDVAPPLSVTTIARKLPTQLPVSISVRVPLPINAMEFKLLKTNCPMPDPSMVPPLVVNVNSRSQN
jgi:hypothetical protein